MLFTDATLMVVVGIQTMYAALHPHPSFVDGNVISQDPRFSWAGAILSAIGLAILWFGRPWW
jgi:hypothetical protein